MNRGLISRPPLGRLIQSIIPNRYGDFALQWRRSLASDRTGSMERLSNLLTPSPTAGGVRASTRVDDSPLETHEKSSLEGLAESKGSAASTDEPWHFHIFSHKHNTHVTITRPDRSPLISMSCGNLGFRKSARKHYDAAYQVGAYVIDKLQQTGKHKEITSLEVVLRGFGAGREAVTKVLLGNEGRLLRPKITRVTDSTRLKFGGTRSKKPRRLG